MLYIPIQVILLAVMASVGGCLIRYATYLIDESPNKKKLNLNYLIIDCFISAFLGFFVFWFNVDDLTMRTSRAMLINCMVGYIGSSILDTASYIVYQKFGIQFKHIKGEPNDSKRDTK